jgi:peptidyl-prolyl cis-trans isomerase B (cyclophilin B)
VIRLLSLALCLLALAVAGCGDDDEEEEQAADTADTQAAAPSGCRQVEAPPPKPEGTEERPEQPLEPGERYVVTLETSCGSFDITLDTKVSPRTTASFVALARDGFYDRTVFHRIVPGFVIQGGDPTGTGSGGPGYFTRDVPPRKTRYTRGIVAMAKTAEEAPGTAGSQFYVVTGDDAGLPPEYALLGRVSAGLEVTRRIDELGDPAGGQEGVPARTVLLEKAVVREP